MIPRNVFLSPVSRWSLAGTLVGVASLFAVSGAGAVTINAAKTSDVATVATCASGAYQDCTSTAHVTKDKSLPGTDADFKKSFDAWNIGNAADKKWTLGDGGALPGGAFTVSQFFAKADASLGGMSIIVDWSYAGADKSDYLWSQGLNLNYKPGDPASTPPAASPSFALDTDKFNNFGACNNTAVGASWGGSFSLTNIYCGPAYPYQTGQRQLGDGPSGPWPNATFEAHAFVSKLDTTNRKLTLYEGLDYGFVLSAKAVPEPGTWLLMAGGLMALGLFTVRRDRRGAAAAA